MDQCLGQHRLEWPFLAHAWLQTGDGDKCFSVPDTNAVSVSLPRLPVLDIRSIPRVLSPFTNKSYCIQDV